MVKMPIEFKIKSEIRQSLRFENVPCIILMFRLLAYMLLNYFFKALFIINDSLEKFHLLEC